MFDLSKYIYSSGSVKSDKGKDFTSAEQAVIIVLSNKCSLEDKLQDLQILINDCTDDAVGKEITLLIQLWNEILNDRYNNTGVIFLANLQEYGEEKDKLFAYYNTNKRIKIKFAERRMLVVIFLWECRKCFGSRA